MTDKKTFAQELEKQKETLDLYVPIVARVHGASHPEFLEVAKTYNQMIEKIEGAGFEDVKLDEDFANFRQITDNYKLPADTCESYEAVYNILSLLDKEYYKANGGD